MADNSSSDPGGLAGGFPAHAHAGCSSQVRGCSHDIRCRPANSRTGAMGLIPGKRIAVQCGDIGSPVKVQSADLLPRLAHQAGFLVQLIIARRAIPRHRHPVGRAGDSSHDRQAGHAAGLREGQMLNFLGTPKQVGHEKARDGQDQNRTLMSRQILRPVHVPQVWLTH